MLATASSPLRRQIEMPGRASAVGVPIACTVRHQTGLRHWAMSAARFAPASSRPTVPATQEQHRRTFPDSKPHDPMPAYDRARQRTSTPTVKHHALGTFRGQVNWGPQTRGVGQMAPKPGKGVAQNWLETASQRPDLHEQRCYRRFVTPRRRTQACSSKSELCKTDFAHILGDPSVGSRVDPRVRCTEMAFPAKIPNAPPLLTSLLALFPTPFTDPP